MAQRVLITAGASGIGRTMASAFAHDGARICVADIDPVALADCPEDWRRCNLDVSDDAAVSSLISSLVADWGGLDTLVTNAGISGPTALVEDVEIDQWRRCIEVNLDGSFLFAKHITPVMKAAGSGSIIMMSSTAGIYGCPNRAPYAASKWAVIGLMKTLAMELGPFGVRVNAICPGCIDGDRIDGVIEREAETKNTTPDKVRAGYQAGVSMRDFASADDVANLAVFLASSQARLISGQAIPVDGHTENPDPKV